MFRYNFFLIFIISWKNKGVKYDVIEMMFLRDHLNTLQSTKYSFWF